ncbi:4-vinyl reductase [Candidatus Bathyarchaeota archaeon]|nr:4-vinyl reductase [Candidatus Bathyarchaeota archaeon]
MRVYESVESSSPVNVKCHFLRGFLSEILRRIYNDVFIDLEECRCKSMGDSYCEFRIK